MPQMTGGQALAKQLYREGVRVIFGLPGVQLYHALDALAQETGIKFITTRHEQATAYMADGYSRSGDDIGTALVVPGQACRTHLRQSARPSQHPRLSWWWQGRWSAT